MNNVVRRCPSAVAGRVRVPGDKSITHRALLYSALADGQARVRNLLASADCLGTVACLRALGVEIEILPIPVDDPLSGPEAIVIGRGLFGLAEPHNILDVGNSGTALRVLPGALAGQPDMIAVLTGDDSIRSRPVDRIIKPLSLMGARIEARAGGRLAPLVVMGGALTGIEYQLPMASAQVKTAILTAGLLADGETVVVEPVVSRDHTEIMLGYLGAAIAVEPLGSGAPETAGRRITITSAPYGAQDIDIPADISSAAFFIAAGILAGEDSVTVVDVGLNPTRAGFLEALSMMGAEISVDSVRTLSGEVVGEVTATRTNLQGAEIGGSMIPRLIDELPLLALLATQAEGRTIVRDASELRVKETDRITLVAAELNRLGADITPTPDGFVIEGPTLLKGAVVRSHGDHRLAMMLGVAGLVAEGETVIEGGEAVDVSFPDFFDRLDLISLA